MKPLPKKQLATFACTVADTRRKECDCDQCLHQVGELAERQLAGRGLNERLRQVEHHLAMCPECREEYVALLRLLRAGK